MNFEEYFDNDTIQIENTIMASDLSKIDTAMPSTIHIIPVRYKPIFPGIITPLIIAKPRFMHSIDEALNISRSIGIVVLKDDDVEDVALDDIEMFGTAAKIIKKINLPDESINVLINSVCRFKINKITEEKSNILAKVDYIYDKANPKNVEIKALTRAILSQLKILSESNPLFTEEMKLTMLNVDEPGRIADFVTSILNLEKHEYQNILETINVKTRLEKVLVLLQKELEVLSVQRKIQNRINEKIYKQQKDYFLREQLKIIKQELGVEDDRHHEIEQMRSSAEALHLNHESREKIFEEINRLNYIESNTPEYTIARTYIDTVLSLPWDTYTDDYLNIEYAEKILKKSHHGLNDVKERIIEFLSVRMLKPDSGGSILCLVGPPGVGKTSLGQAIADSLKRNFFRVSLGGIRDEAEIKGHRRTYIGAMPGKIIQGMKICKSKNPVFMLDEIDKLYQSYQGDPAASLLEVLDYEQNHAFRDHYIDMPFDLSKVFFITTANTSETIPDVLLDRMEVIRIPGYIAEEKYEIAKHFLLPKQLKKHGLAHNPIKLDKNALYCIINGWAREAGVRGLNRQIERLCRKKAKSIVKQDDSFPEHLDSNELRRLLGAEIYTDDTIPEKLNPGVAIGLAWTTT
ncbi:MAG TPA: endopeptidase La, partial [Spirochaetota bacterium]|nr:endopeptidase La [Spirochaetota bacterium]